MWARRLAFMKAANAAVALQRCRHRSERWRKPGDCARARARTSAGSGPVRSGQSRRGGTVDRRARTGCGNPRERALTNGGATAGRGGKQQGDGGVGPGQPRGGVAGRRSPASTRGAKLPALRRARGRDQHSPGHRAQVQRAARGQEAGEEVAPPCLQGHAAARCGGERSAQPGIIPRALAADGLRQGSVGGGRATARRRAPAHLSPIGLSVWTRAPGKQVGAGRLPMPAVLVGDRPGVPVVGVGAIARTGRRHSHRSSHLLQAACRPAVPASQRAQQPRPARAASQVRTRPRVFRNATCGPH